MGGDARASVVAFLRLRDVETPGGAALLPRRYGLIDELYVEPARRGLGVARALLSTAEAWARERGITALEVTVWDFNDGAQRFYEREGFGAIRRYLRKLIQRLARFRICVLRAARAHFMPDEPNE